ncbi:MAG: selenocysteine lyase [Gemmatimonadetes bacterium]|jgi:UDP-sulfoquinovose synthase|nr:selenocysteine lyase [Gemmatimonadota bacterium]
MSVLVLGADGYLGWALLCKLATTVDEPLVAVDDLSKRRRVSEQGTGSAIPILEFDERIALLRAVTGRSDITGVRAEVVECVEPLVREHAPRAVVHLAQIPSAPYSMASFAAARETIVNNEIGNLAVLYALRDHAPDAHLVKMGSMGEYAACGVPLGEGYVDAILDGEPTSCPIPFPRAADDVYHITKINDTNFIAMACRLWGLPSTDVMQSIVYGTRTALWRADPRLATRFDCDPVFGSVLNRFVAQAVRGVPLTVHAGGRASTGLISLTDSVCALDHWIANPPARGEHRVINQATETRISVLAIAQLVQRLGAERGLDVQLNMELDPRHELERASSAGPARNLRLRESAIPTIPLEQGVRYLLADLFDHAERLGSAGLTPEVDWKTGASETGAVSPPASGSPAAA